MGPSGKLQNDKLTQDKFIQEGRRFLRSNWDLLDGVQTDQSRGLPVPDQQKPPPPGARRIDLVTPERFTVGRIPLIDAIRERRSRRQYSDALLSREELSFLLFATQGVRKRTPKYSLRTVPSGGARHSLESYVYVERVREMEPGLYRYLPLDHVLCLLDARDGLKEELNEALFGQYWNAAAVFVWTAIPYRMEWRYSVVSHKVIALDAGHVCQNLYLACESIGCGTCAIGAYHQEKMDRFLMVDGRDEFAIYAAPVGKVE